MKRLFATASLSFLVLLFVSPAFAQDDSVEEEEVKLPDSVMQQVVRRIIQEKVSSHPALRKIYLSDRNLRREWLPAVRNVKFVLISDSQLDAVSRQVNFFKKLRLVEGVYELDFGFGDPECSATGSTWYFQISRGRLEFLDRNGGWGMGCSSGH